MTPSPSAGACPPHGNLPTSWVAHNTVVLAYQQLIDEGYLISRSAAACTSKKSWNAGWIRRQDARALPRKPFWLSRLKTSVPREQEFSCPQTGSNTLPFHRGSVRPIPVPDKEWRKPIDWPWGARYQRVGRRDRRSRRSHADRRDPQKKILPRRGIQATPTDPHYGGHPAGPAPGGRIAGRSTVPVAMEEPGYPGMRHLLERRGAPGVPARWTRG